MTDETETPSEKVGWIGLGQIGAPMARRLLAHPGGLVVCDVVTEATERFARDGAGVAVDAAGVATSGATVISVMVRDDAQVRTVVGQILPVATSGTVVAVHSTVLPETAEELAVAGAAHGVHVVDAPVSGGAMGAHGGRLAVMAGGAAEAIERCREPFALFADLVVHFGPTGSGTRAKIARNLITFAAYAAVGEAQQLAEAAGLDLVALGEVVRHSDAVTGGPGAVMIRATAAPVADDDPMAPILTHTRSLGEKDLALAVALGARLGIDTPVAAVALAQLAASLGVPHEQPSGGR